MESLIDDFGDLIYSHVLSDVFGSSVSGRFSDKEKTQSLGNKIKGYAMTARDAQRVLNDIQNMQSQPQSGTSQSSYQPIP